MFTIQKGKVEVYLMVKFCAVVKFQRSTNSFRTDESGNSINSTKLVKKVASKESLNFINDEKLEIYLLTFSFSFLSYLDQSTSFYLTFVIH